MATWDKRDPRWHVVDRPDGNNVNGWHWEERNRVAWTKQRLSELLGSGLPPAQVDPALGHAAVSGVSAISGEAYQTMRKGNKTFAVYDLQVTLDWQGRWLESDTEVKGDITITEFCSTNEPEEYEITVSATGNGLAQDTLKTAVQGLQPAILERLEQYVAELNALPLS